MIGLVVFAAVVMAGLVSLVVLKVRWAQQANRKAAAFAHGYDANK